MVNIIVAHFQAAASFRSELEPAGIIVVSQTFKTTEDPTETISDLLVSELMSKTA